MDAERFGRRLATHGEGRQLDDLAWLGPVEAVMFDAGGVLVLPNPRVITEHLRTAGFDDLPDDETLFVRAHYEAMRAFDAAQAAADPDWRSAYPAGYAAGLGLPEEAVEPLAWLLEQPSDGVWTHYLRENARGMAELASAGYPVAVVSNSDGTVEQVLADGGVCQIGPGDGTEVAAVVDSTVFGVAKPDPAIFVPALEAVGSRPDRTLYVGDSEWNDVGGATAAGMIVVILDPFDLRTGLAHPRISSVRFLASHLVAEADRTPI